MIDHINKRLDALDSELQSLKVKLKETKNSELQHMFVKVQIAVNLERQNDFLVIKNLYDNEFNVMKSRTSY